jgi:ubiquinone/menaquinone biosynthesis C-methylase UbiE
MVAQSMDGMNSDNTIKKISSRHFSSVAKKYRDLRTTDSEPISLIVDKMKNLDRVEAVDVGCGDGRYDLLLYKYLGDKLRLTCLDANADMLQALTKYLTQHDIDSFSVKCSEAETMPFPDSVLDCVCTFNAVHHFNLSRFLSESARVIKAGGYLFIYTRLREQNGRNIWGLYFPQFNEKETRLYSLDAMKEAIERADNLAFESIVLFAYSRLAALEQLLERARSHHYSTFLMYSPEEMEEALKGFSLNIKNQFEDPQRIRWFDENALFIIRKKD